MLEVTGNPNMSLLDVECYASRPSGYFHQDGSHGFVTSKDRTITWNNHGGGYDSRKKELAGSSKMYREWAMEFVPPNNIPKCGIEFGVNGLCHTLANREMLLTEDGPSMKGSYMDYPLVVFFGKYGLGLSQLKELLKSTYDATVTRYNDPYNAYRKVIARLEPSAFLDDELDAWIDMAKSWGIKVDEIMRKPLASREYAKMRIYTLVNEREEIYRQYQSSKNGNYRDMQKKIVERVRINMTNCLNYLVQISYISQIECSIYVTNMNAYLATLTTAIGTEREYFLANGHMLAEANYVNA